MLEPQRMDKVLIVGTKDVMEPTINALHEMNILHVEDYIEEEAYFHIGKPLKNAAPLSEKLLKLRSIKSYLGTKIKAPEKEKRDRILSELDSNLALLETQVGNKMSEKSSLESELKDLAHKEEILRPYEALGLPLDLLHGYENVAVFIGTVPADIEPAIKSVTNDYELFSSPYEKGNVVALFVPKAVAAKISEALLKSDFVEIEQLHEKGEPAAIKKNITGRKNTVSAKLDAISKDLKELNDKYARFILSSEELLTIDTQKAEAPLRFATSDNTFVVDGWVPTVDFEKFRDTLVKATNDKVYVAKVEPEHKAYSTEVNEHVPEHHEVDAPVKYNNPKYAYPLQAFIDLYSRPRYDEIDPTMIFFFLFPIFYGFILGDIAYGLILFAIGFWLRGKLKHSEGWQILTNALMICAASSIVFGAIFGEFLGISIAQYYPHHITIGPIGPFSLPIERLFPGGFGEEGAYIFGIKDLLVFTCIVGVCHILLGYLIGFRNEYVQHDLKTALLHKVSWILILLGGVSLVVYIFPMMVSGTMGNINMMNPLFLAGAAMAIVGLIMLLMGEGAIGVLEIPTLMSNVLSYTRLLAVGLSSVGIAFAVNTIVGMMMPSMSTLLTPLGIIGLIGAIIVFLLGHSINLVLGVIAPGLHALRLHYVEFFTKFYKGGGRIYNPFGYIRKYTEE